MATRLVTSRYTQPGVYIGELIRPQAGNLTADARVCNYIGRGSRLATGSNLGIRRSFVSGEALTFPTTAPFEAPLNFAADGNKNPPARLYNSITGVEVRSDQWNFVKVSGAYTKVIVESSAFDPLAVYKLDYQSTSSAIQDPLPVQALRLIKAVGNQQDRAQYIDFQDFYIPFGFAGPTAESTNSVPSAFLTAILSDGANAGGGTVAIDAAASYNHNYNRFYQLTVTAVAGVAGSYTATFDWKAVPYSGGEDSLPPTPIHSTVASPSFTADETDALSLVQELELGIKVEISFDAANFAIGDKFYFNGVGPGLLEWDGRLSNANQYVSYGDIADVLEVGSTGSLAYAESNSYSGTYNVKFKLQCTAKAGAPGVRTATFAWASYGDVLGASGSVSINEATSSLNLSLTQGVVLTAAFGAVNFAVGDVFDLEIKAPRVYYQAKDNRVYTLKVSSALNPGADVGVVNGSYSTGTVEGGFGSWTANVNNLSGAFAQSGAVVLPDNAVFFVRNAMRGNVNGTSYATADEFTGSITSTGVIDWSLSAKAEEVRETSSFLVDVTGSITGTPGTTYIILDNVPQSGTVAVAENVSPFNSVSFVEVTNTRFIAFVTAPTVAVKVNYTYKGAEPAPGQLYYFSANYLRPAELYNNPTLILSRAEGRTFLAPSQTDNHLYIMNELVWDNGAAGAYYTQVLDADGDGIIQDTDVRAALDAHEKLSRPTDLCLLSLFGSLAESLQVNIKLNDPFERKQQMLWIGTPIGTPVGDIDTPDSLVFLAQRTLQVTPTSPAQGTRVLLAPTTCRKTITLENGTSQQLTLDGSFVAGATSALVNSFADPAATILRQNLTGFDFVQTYTEPVNLILGQASVLYMSDLGSGVYRFEEDVTIHTLSEEFQLISSTTQKQYVTRVVRREMDNALISVVVPSSQAAIALIKANLAGILLGLRSRGLIGDYQDDNGNVRDFDPDTDILVFRDTASLTRYDFAYSFFLRTPIKRLFGLFSVNTSNLTQVVG